MAPQHTWRTRSNNIAPTILQRHVSLKNSVQDVFNLEERYCCNV
jgi:hypothetical protein